MRAVPLPFTHRKLLDFSRELYLEHGWRMPDGLAKSGARDPVNFSLAERQQAKRAASDPKTIKLAFMEAWSVSDSKASLIQALKKRGFILAHGGAARTWHGQHRRDAPAGAGAGSVYGKRCAAGIPRAL